MIIILELLRINQLKKQFLIPIDTFGDQRPSFYDLVENQLGLHSTDYWTPYLSIFARIGNYDAKELWNSLNSGRKLMKMNAFRGTVFLINTSNYNLINSAIGTSRYKNLLKAPPIRNLKENTINKLINQLIEVFEDDPLSTNDIKKKFNHIMNHLILNL